MKGTAILFTALAAYCAIIGAWPLSLKCCSLAGLCDFGSR